jgi:hypothetical protein
MFTGTSGTLGEFQAGAVDPLGGVSAALLGGLSAGHCVALGEDISGLYRVDTITPKRS